MNYSLERLKLGVQLIELTNIASNITDILVYVSYCSDDCVCKDILEEYTGKSVESGTHGKTQKLRLCLDSRKSTKVLCKTY